jgi:hypothetical protein
MSSSNQISAITAAGLQPSPQRRRVAWPFAATMLGASLLGIGLAYCVRTLSIPVWGLDGGGASLLPGDVVCASENSSGPPETIRRE